MKIKSLKNYKTYEKLNIKQKGQYWLNKVKMPSLPKISELLNEIGIEHSLSEYWETKQTSPAGYRYYTGGGTRDYNGWQLKVPELNMNIQSTATYYSYNTWSYAGQIVELINKTLK